MSRKFKYYADGAAEMWDDEAGTYSRFDNAGYEVERRTLTETEENALSPSALKIRKMGLLIEQLILGQLMTGKAYPRVPMVERLQLLYQKGRLDLEGLNKAVSLFWINEQQKQSIIASGQKL